MRTYPAVTTFVKRALGIDGSPTEADWRRMLEFADRVQLTLFLDATSAPAFVLEAIENRTEANRERLARLNVAYDEVARKLARSGIDFTVLKGFTHADLGANRGRRVQYDIDLLCAPADAEGAAQALASLGYLPHASRSLSDQHLPPLVKPTGWNWKGDYYDPDIPIPIEIHTSLWNHERERLHIHDVERFPHRREFVEVDNLSLPALSGPDRLAYACLHALRHILRDDARPAHVFEIGVMANTVAERPDFWSQWFVLHDPGLHAAQAVALRFVQEWFGFPMPAEPARAIACLPRRIDAWFEGFAWSPVRNLVEPRPNKDVIWLHYGMLATMRERAAMLRRRLMPVQAAVAGPAAERARHHASAIAPALASGFRWWRRATASSTAAQTSA